jgi:hypothetical protein
MDSETRCTLGTTKVKNVFQVASTKELRKKSEKVSVSHFQRMWHKKWLISLRKKKPFIEL